MHHSITGQYLARYRRTADGADTPRGLLPLTGAQRRFLLVRSLDPQGRPDVVPLFFAFPRGTVDLARLRAAAGYLAALHPALRARPEVVRGTPVQRLADADVPAVRVEAAPGENATDALRRALSGWRAEGSPLRLFLAHDADVPADTGAAHETGAPTEILAIALDHTACDGQSLSRVVEELTAAYAAALGLGDVPPAAADQEADAYREAVFLQLETESRAGAPAALGYWGERLRAVREAAPSPRSLPPGALPSGAAELRLTAGAAPLPFPGLLAACAAAAQALYGEGTHPLGYPWGGRPAAARPVLGCFLNTVVFPATAAAAGPDAHAAPATAWWDDLDRADTPFDEVVRAARAAGAPWSGRLDGLLTVEDAQRTPTLRLGGVAGREVYVDGRPVRAPFAVSVSQGREHSQSRELLVRMAWDRSVLDDNVAADAFGALTGALRAQILRPAPMA
ncbi:non-ribosomal peptide synthetase [Streptomyces sp. NPDC050610]|uniref:non-ribosomal peptide synthetase n=1 Tax=Streptomyces sp. NPDC050610 TaxID=3157097 RepID=UPI00342524A8